MLAEEYIELGDIQPCPGNGKQTQPRGRRDDRSVGHLAPCGYAPQPEKNSFQSCFIYGAMVIVTW